MSATQNLVHLLVPTLVILDALLIAWGLNSVLFGRKA